MSDDGLTGRIIGCCFEVHNEIGVGFPEKIYQQSLKLALKAKGISFQEEVIFDVKFKDEKVGKFRCDLVIENQVILELKAVSGIMPKIFQSQILSYLKASGIKTGLLINFGNTKCEIKRYVY